MIFDTHLHPISADRAKYPLDPLAGERAAGFPPNEAATIVALMKEAGVDGAALVQFVGVYGYDNACIADSAAGNPGAFAAVCSVDPFDPAAPQHLSRLAGAGVRGLRLFTPAGRVEAPSWPDVPTVLPLMETARSLGITVNAQVQPGQLRNFRSLAARFPGMPVLIDHLGGNGYARDSTPGAESELLGLSELENVYLKFSTLNLRHLEGPEAAASMLRSLIARFGALRLLWGSNYPVSRDAERGYAGLLEEARAILGGVASEAEQALILGDNAAKFYGPRTV